MPETVYPVAVFRNVHDNEPQQEFWSWEEIAARLTSHLRRAHKDGPCWSPTLYPPEKTRSKDNVLALTCLVLDFDEGDDLSDVAESGGWHALAYVAHSSFNHTEQHPKWRAVFPLSRPVPAEDWDLFFLRARFALTGNRADRICRNKDRVYYFPSCPWDAEPFIRENRGACLDVGSLLAIDLPEPELIRENQGTKPTSATPFRGLGDYRTLDVVAWFTAHGAYGRSLGGDKHAVLCPWENQHTEQRGAEHSDTAVWEAREPFFPAFHCQHAHCEGRRIHDVMALWGDADQFCREAYRPEVPPPPEEPLPEEPENWASEEEEEPPLDESEAPPEPEKKEGGSSTVAAHLVKIAFEAEIFRTADGGLFASIEDAERRRTYPLHSTDFGQWIELQYYRRQRKLAGREAVYSALRVIQGYARYEAETRPVFLRTAALGGKYYLDLGDETWRAVEIDAAGWRIVSKPPVRFRRAEGMLPLPVPVAGDLRELARFVNVDPRPDWKTGDEEASLMPLLGSWLLAAAGPAQPYPILILSGEQGSAKSTAARALRRLIDPNKADLRGIPIDARDLAITAHNSLVVVLDNVTAIPPWLSDCLARLATGSGFSTRRLYKDDEEVIFQAVRPILLTGIGDFVKAPDLLDRGLQAPLPRVVAYRDETKFWSEYEEARPALLGGLLDAVSTAARTLPRLELEGTPRMADFTRWAVAGEPAYARTGEFLAAYKDSRSVSYETTRESSPVALAVQWFMQSRDKEEWAGNAGALLEALPHAIPPPAGWPKTPERLGMILTQVAPSLRNAGIDITRGRDQEGRWVRISCLKDEQRTLF